MRKSILLFFTLFLSCDNMLGPPAIIDQPFWLNFGQRRVVEPVHVEVEFKVLVNESRCPSDVRCVWEGVARISLELQLSDTSAASVEASIFGYVTKTDTLRHVSTDTLGYKFTLMELNPYPISTKNPNAWEYRALLKVSKL